MPRRLCEVRCTLSRRSASCTASSEKGSNSPDCQARAQGVQRVMCHRHLHLVCQSTPQAGHTLPVQKKRTALRCPCAVTMWLLRLRIEVCHLPHCSHMNSSGSNSWLSCSAPSGHLGQVGVAIWVGNDRYAQLLQHGLRLARVVFAPCNPCAQALVIQHWRKPI